LVFKVFKINLLNKILSNYRTSNEKEIHKQNQYPTTNCMPQSAGFNQQQNQILVQQKHDPVAEFSQTPKKAQMSPQVKPITPAVQHYQPIATNKLNQPNTSSPTSNMTGTQQQPQSNFIQIFMPKLAPMNNTGNSNIINNSDNTHQASNIIYTTASQTTGNTPKTTIVAKKATTPRTVTPKTTVNASPTNSKTPTTPTVFKRQAKKRTNSSTNVPIAPLNTNSLAASSNVAICNGNTITVANTIGQQNLSNIAPKAIQAKTTTNDSNSVQYSKIFNFKNYKVYLF